MLDFGLAKAWQAEAGDVGNSPTLSMAATAQGIILGTAAYMAPEQARGQAVDHRADIWAFGCVLFEMLTGRQTFRGDLVSDILASVLAREPEFAELPPTIAPRLKDALQRCLEKNPKRRLAGDWRPARGARTNPHQPERRSRAGGECGLDAESRCEGCAAVRGSRGDRRRSGSLVAEARSCSRAPTTRALRVRGAPDPANPRSARPGGRCWRFRRTGVTLPTTPRTACFCARWTRSRRGSSPEPSRR